MDPRRLENEDEEKFWEAWIKDELTFCYRFGKIGSPGGTKLKKFKTAAEAQAELEEKLKQKLAEGFVELGVEEEEEAEEEADEEEKEAESEAEDSEDEDDEEEEAEEEADEKEDDEEEEEEEGDESDNENDGEDEEEEEDSEPPPPPPPPKPTLPQRCESRARPASTHEVEAVTERLVAVSKSLGGRSWRVMHRTRSASRALARLGGVDPEATPALARELSLLMASVIAPKKRLSLDAALALLWEVDATAAKKTVVGWRAKMLSSPASTAIGVLAATFDAVPDPEVALHTGVALVERHLSPAAWKLRFAKIVPFLEESLATTGSTVPKFLATLRTDGDPIVKARVSAAPKVKGNVKLDVEPAPVKDAKANAKKWAKR